MTKVPPWQKGPLPITQPLPKVSREILIANPPCQHCQGTPLLPKDPLLLRAPLHCQGTSPISTGSITKGSPYYHRTPPHSHGTNFQAHRPSPISKGSINKPPLPRYSLISKDSPPAQGPMAKGPPIAKKTYC